MSDCLKSSPKSWHAVLVLSAVPKDGSVYRDSFYMTLDKPVAYWQQEYEFAEPLFVVVEAYRTGGRLLAEISLDAKAVVPCSRCLEPSGVAINWKLRYLFSLRPNEYTKDKDKEEEHEDGDEEIILLDSWEDEIDLVPFIWEVLITSLPAVVLCSDSCSGLCPQCGANLNKSLCGCKAESGDPRFEVLRAFVDKE